MSGRKKRPFAGQQEAPGRGMKDESLTVKILLMGKKGTSPEDGEKTPCVLPAKGQN